MHPDLITRQLDGLIERHRRDDSGALADYIPELSKADPSWFGMSLCTVDGAIYESGDSGEAFTIQSISKPFVYALALMDRGADEVMRRVGVEPSGDAFNSIVLDRTNRPHNPMVNAGAITMVSLVQATSPDERFRRILWTLSAFAGRSLSVDESVYASEAATGHRNRAIAHLMRTVGSLEGDVDEVLDSYFRQCSVLITSRDLAVMTATLATGGINPITGRRVASEDVVADVISVMLTAGMYDYSGEWAYTTGLPAKSGVGGGVAALVPGQAGVGVFSPLLDERGNSVRGVAVCRELSSHLGFHLFRNRAGGMAPIRSVTTGRDRRSLRVRPNEESVILDRHGDRVAIVEMQGPWSFVACERLLAELSDRTYDHLVLDTSRVSVVDTSAETVLTRLVVEAGEDGVEVLVAGPVPPALEAVPARQFVDLDQALEWCEERLIGAGSSAEAATLADSDLGRALSASDLAELERITSERTIPAGACLWNLGDEAGAMFLVLEGHLSAHHHGRRLASFGPGAIVGEMGFLTGEARSATVVADTAARVCEIDDLDRLPITAQMAIHRALAVVSMGRLAVTNRTLAAARS